MVLMVVPSDLGRPRPGVIVQANETIVGLDTVIVCPLSSDLQERLSLRPTVEISSENGLNVRSQIMTDKLLALRRDRIRRVIGRIDAGTSEQLDRALLVLLGVTSIGVYGIALAGWSSNNKYSLLGALRASAQMVSYELSLGLSLIGVLILTGSLSLRQIVDRQGTLPWQWNIIAGGQLVAFFIYLTAAFAE